MSDENQARQRGLWPSLVVAAIVLLAFGAIGYGLSAKLQPSCLPTWVIDFAADECAKGNPFACVTLDEVPMKCMEPYVEQLQQLNTRPLAPIEPAAIGIAI